MPSTRFNPFTVRLDEFDQLIKRVHCRHVIFDAFFADVEVDFGRCPTDVAEVGVRHFAWTVDDAAHDGDRHTFQVIGARADRLRDRL